MTTESAAKKDIQKLQRAIVEGLEDVKAQDIQVFNTEHLSPLFERVIVASGTSNRQTKALASSVRDAVRDAGFAKPRVEGEDNGEWIIVDCGQAVAHIMQPAIRQYYHLEEIWGEKPVRLRLGATKPTAGAAATATAKARERDAKARAEREKAQGPSLKRSSAAKTAVRAAEREAQAAKASRSSKAAKAAKATQAAKSARAAPSAKSARSATPARAGQTAQPARSAPAGRRAAPAAKTVRGSGMPAAAARKTVRKPRAA